jgi:hypothetical protein
METVIETLEIGKAEVLKEINKIEMYYATGQSPLNINALTKILDEKRLKIKKIEDTIKSLRDKPIMDLQTQPGVVSTIKYMNKIISFSIDELEEFLKTKALKSYNSENK